MSAETGLTIFIVSVKYFSYCFFSSLGSYYNWIGIIRVDEDIKINKQSIEKELVFLKGQFHSHLTFNFLNFCYNKIRIFSKDVADSIEDFSNILRYSLKRSSGKFILLKEEIKYIEDIILFYKCFQNNFNVEFNYSGDVENIYILPRILSIFIEKSIDHEITENKFPVTIEILSNTSEITLILKRELKFLLEFEKHLNRIRPILELFYKDKYILLINNDRFFFYCELKLSQNN